MKAALDNSTRFTKTKTNLIWQFIYQIVILALGLILPRIIISVYGSEVNGLTAAAKNIVLVVSLAKAGIGTAVTYSLYRPVNEGDRLRIASIIYSVKSIFARIGIVVAILGFVASIVMAVYNSGNLIAVYVFFACLLMCANTAIDISLTAVYNVFFSATQDRHIISIGLLIAGVITYSIEIVFALFRAPYVLLYTACIIGCFAKIFFFKKVFQKKYKSYKLLENEKIESNKVHLKGVGYATLNEISHSVVVASQTIIISVVCGYAKASVYSIYAMIVNALSLISQVVYSSFSSSFGSLVAEGDINRINTSFRIFQFSYMTLNTFMYMCATFLMMPFIKIYTASLNDVNYISTPLMCGFICYGILYAVRVPYNIVVSTHGIFKKSGIQTSLTCIVCLFISIIAALTDYSYVVFGLVLFYGTNTVYQHFMLKKEIPGFENSHFIRHIIVTIIGVLSMAALSKTIPSALICKSFENWFFCALITALSSVILLLALLFAIDRKCLVEAFYFFRMKLKRGAKTK